MDISIYCRKPTRLELIERELAENINAIVADLHARLDELAKEYQPEPVAITDASPSGDPRQNIAVLSPRHTLDVQNQQWLMLNRGAQFAGFVRNQDPRPGSVIYGLFGSCF